MQTIFLDFEYAVDEHAEEALWSSHILINKEYRSLINRLKKASHAVEKRKADKVYSNFLRVAQKFYKAYIQRLGARYDIAELKRIARGIDVESMVADDAISPVPSALQAKVLQSCHATLIRLGDLARYRVQAKEKKSGYDVVLTYYGLAHQLVPDNGFAYHQMGIVSLAQDNHLDIIYHFYRSWAIRTPHPNAEQNVQQEFKAVQSSATKPGATRAQDAFIMWFVRLHAFFYKGEVFSQQKELETEVLHRLRLSIEDPESRTMLLTMAMVNMSAHFIASKKYNENPKSEKLARFYQFVLRFNIVFLSSISAFLEKDLRDSITNSQDDSDGSKSGKLSKAAESTLAVLRIYCAWLGAHHSEIYQPDSPIRNEIFSMMDSLSQVFTLLCVETYGKANLASCSYLLSEDLDVLGLEPLSIERLPEPCRFYCTASGVRKPMLQAASQRLDGSGEKLSRILDILRCAYFLASETGVPLTQQVIDGYLLFECKTITTAKNANDAKSTASQPTPTTTGLGLQGVQQLGTNVTYVNEQDHAPKHQTKNNLVEAEDPENTVMTMLTPFLRPPTPDTELGRHVASDNANVASSVTNKVAQVPLGNAFEAKPITAAKFAPLPWNWFNTPQPGAEDNLRSTMPRQLSLQASPTRSPMQSIRNSVGGDGSFPSPSLPTMPNEASNMSRSYSTASTHHADAAHRAQLLQSLTGNRQHASPRWEQDQAFHSGTFQSTWSPQIGANNFPGGSNMSNFSHTSTLLHGSPANGFGLGMNANRSASLGSAWQSPVFERESAHPARHLRMDDTTTSYDEAILRAAYDGTT